MSDTPLGDMVEAMLAKDTPAEVVVLAVRTAEIASRVTQRDATSRATPAQRSPGAERSARWREKQRQSKALAEANDAAIADTPSVTPQRHAQRHGVTPRCDSFFLEEERGNRSKEKEDRPEKLEGRKRGTRLQAGSPLSDSDLQFALSQGMTEPVARRAWAEFVDYWIGVPGQRGCKLDWSATWRNRVRELIARKPRAGEVKWRSGIEGVV